MFHHHTSSKVTGKGIEIKSWSKAEKQSENMVPDQESWVQPYLTLLKGQNLRLLSSKYPPQNGAFSLLKAQKAVYLLKV